MKIDISKMSEDDLRKLLIFTNAIGAAKLASERKAIFADEHQSEVDEAKRQAEEYADRRKTPGRWSNGTYDDGSSESKGAAQSAIEWLKRKRKTLN